MEPKISSFKCPEHCKPITHVVPNNITSQNTLCYDCLNNQNLHTRVPINDYIDMIAKAQSEYTTIITNVKKKLPKNLKDLPELEEGAVKKLREYFEGQKGQVEYLFDKLLSDLKTLFKVEKDKIFNQFEEQIKTLERNFSYYNLKLLKYESKDEIEPLSFEAAKNEALEGLSNVKNSLKLYQWVKDTNEDVEDLTIYNKFKSDENKLKGVARCLKFLSQQIENQTHVRPVLRFNEDSITELKKNLEQFFEKAATLDNPIRELSISSYYFDSEIISTPKDFEFVRTLFDIGNSTNIIQRVFLANDDQKQLAHLHVALQKCREGALILLETEFGNVIGAYSDKDWEVEKIQVPTGEYHYSHPWGYGHYSSPQPIYKTQFNSVYKQTNNSIIIDFDQKKVLEIKSSKRSEAVWVPADLNLGVYFGNSSIPDLHISNNGTNGFRGRVNPGTNYHPTGGNKEERNNIVETFAGGKDNWNFAIKKLEVFVIVSPEKYNYTRDL